MSTPSPRPPKSAAQRLFGFLSSFGLATTLFVLLAVLVLFATLAQVNIGIHDVKRDYFSSAFVIHRFFSEASDGTMVPSRLGIPLIGGYPLMALLFVNILLGGLIRIRKKPQTIGVVISHFSMLLLLAWGFVTNHFVDEGYAQIYENDQVDYFVDYTKWDMELVKETGEDARDKVHLLPFEQLAKLEKADSKRVFANAAWPFEITVSGFARNSNVGLARGFGGKLRDIDGFALNPLEPGMEAERNIPGAYVDVGAEGAPITAGIVWGLARQPLTITDSAGDKWSLSYRKRVYELPYAIKLREFHKEEHPGTAMAKRYMSDVTKIDDGVEDESRIRMNHPLVAGQHTFYQASFGPGPNDPPGTPVYTVLAVWKRPLMAGDWPVWAFFMVFFGLLIHFGIKLFSHFGRESKREARRAAKEAEASEETDNPEPA